MSVFGVILVRIFPHSDWIRGDTRISPYSVWLRENAYQNNSEYGHILRSIYSFNWNFVCLILSWCDMSIVDVWFLCNFVSQMEALPKIFWIFFKYLQFKYRSIPLCRYEKYVCVSVSNTCTTAQPFPLASIAISDGTFWISTFCTSNLLFWVTVNLWSKLLLTSFAIIFKS